MALSAEQYHEIQEILAARRSRAFRLQNARQEEIDAALPAIEKIGGELAALSVEEAEVSFGRREGDPEEIRKRREALMLEKRRLLAEAGYGSDYLDIRYHCMECRDTGYRGLEKCGCFKKLESEILNRESGLPAILDRENFGTFDPYIFDDEKPLAALLPKRVTQYEYMTVNVMNVIRDFIDSFEDSPGRSILMMGPAGTGKTFLSNCIAKALIDRQHTVMYERSGEMFEKLSGQAFSRIQTESAARWHERLFSCELLVIDDLGTEFTTDFSKSRLFSLISNRLSAGLSTIISTNLSLNQLSSLYGERVTSRFIGEYILLPFYGSDLRNRRK